MFQNLNLSLPKMGDRFNSINNVISTTRKSTVPAVYVEDSVKIKNFHNNPRETIDIYKVKMAYSPLQASVYKAKIDVLEQICELVDDIESVRINNASLFVPFDNFVAINDEERNYPMMLMPESFIGYSESLDCYYFKESPSRLRKMFEDRFAATSTIAQLRFLTAATSSVIQQYGLFGSDFFQINVSVLVLVTLSMDVFMYPELFGSPSNEAYYSYIMLMISYMYNVKTPSGLIMNSGIFGINEERKDIVLAGFGPIGLIGKMYCKYTMYLDFIEYSIKNGIHKKFQSYLVINEMEEKKKIDKVIKDAIKMSSVLGTVNIDGEIIFVDVCKSCVEYTGSLISMNLIKEVVMNDCVLLKYGCVTACGVDFSHALKILQTYMSDCVFIKRPESQEEIITVTMTGDIVKNQEIYDSKCRLRHIYKKKLRILNYTKFKLVQQGELVNKRDFDGTKGRSEGKVYVSVCCHDEQGNLKDVLMEDEDIQINKDMVRMVKDKLSRVSHLTSDLQSVENEFLSCKDLEDIGDCDGSSDDNNIISDNPSNVSENGDDMKKNEVYLQNFSGYEKLDIEGSKDVFQKHAPDEEGLVSSSYAYVMGIKRIVMFIMHTLGIDVIGALRLMRGNYVDLQDYTGVRLDKVKDYSMFKVTKTDKLVVRYKLGVMMGMIFQMIDRGELRVYRRADNHEEIMLQYVRDTGKAKVIAYF